MKLLVCALVLALLLGLFSGCSGSDDDGASDRDTVLTDSAEAVEAGIDAGTETGTGVASVEASEAVGAVSTIAAGDNLSFAIKTDGSLWAWDSNEYAKSGYDKLTPYMVMENVASVSMSSSKTMAIGTDGVLWVWDNDDLYQSLGANPADIPAPIRLMDDVCAVSVGDAHTMAIRNDGNLWAWGDNDSGKLGDGTTTDRQMPVRVMGNMAAVSAGRRHTMAIRNDGSLWAWGGNAFGQLGDGTTIDRLEPILIMEDVFSVSAGIAHTMAIRNDGSLWAWGRNDFGQLGDGTTHDRLMPTKVLEGVIAVSAGVEHTLAIRTNNSMWAWGIGNDGRLGMNIFHAWRYAEPVPLRIMEGVTAVSAGNTRSMALGSNGGLLAFGGYEYGQLWQDMQAGMEYPTVVMDDVMLPLQGFPKGWHLATPEPFPGKIALITETPYNDTIDTVAAMTLLNKYGVDKIVHRYWPRRSNMDHEQVVAILEEIAADKDIRALVLPPPVKGVSAAVDRFLELRDDVFIVYINPWEEPQEVVARADLVITTNSVLMGESIVLQAKALGAKTFVFYAYPRQLAIPFQAARRDLIKTTCESNGVEFVEVSIPDVMGDIGHYGALQVIIDDLPEQVAKFGKDTAFYNSSCLLQEALILGVIKLGAIHPQPCCPSPYHGFDSTLRNYHRTYLSEISGGNLIGRDLSPREIVESTRIAIAKQGSSCRLSTWPASEYMMWLNAGVEYAVKWINDEVPAESIDYDALSSICAAYSKEIIGEELSASFEPFALNGRVYRHWVMGLMDYLVY